MQERCYTSNLRNIQRANYCLSTLNTPAMECLLVEVNENLSGSTATTKSVEFDPVTVAQLWVTVCSLGWVSTDSAHKTVDAICSYINNVGNLDVSIEDLIELTKKFYSPTGVLPPNMSSLIESIVIRRGTKTTASNIATLFNELSIYGVFIPSLHDQVFMRVNELPGTQNICNLLWSVLRLQQKSKLCSTVFDKNVNCLLKLIDTSQLGCQEIIDLAPPLGCLTISTIPIFLEQILDRCLNIMQNENATYLADALSIVSYIAAKHKVISKEFSDKVSKWLLDVPDGVNSRLMSIGSDSAGYLLSSLIIGSSTNGHLMDDLKNRIIGFTESKILSPRTTILIIRSMLNNQQSISKCDISEPLCGHACSFSHDLSWGQTSDVMNSITKFTKQFDVLESQNEKRRLIQLLIGNVVGDFDHIPLENLISLCDSISRICEPVVQDTSKVESRLVKSKILPTVLTSAFYASFSALMAPVLVTRSNTELMTILEVYMGRLRMTDCYFLCQICNALTIKSDLSSKQCIDALEIICNASYCHEDLFQRFSNDLLKDINSLSHNDLANTVYNFSKASKCVC
eukprot:GHVL01023624.1.p1 GENE.GHVL01023624.1~~GHVL01023624.1.p1  ORF type:complete len:668 (-),score=83.33 GHVL01023624.1:1080-2792(-)